MGAGKTTIGRQLAKATGKEFVDSDHEIENRTGASIPWIFDVEGEEGFRRREREMLAELTEREGTVIATGGGAVLSPETRKLMRKRGLVIYLRASVDQILRRTARDRNRPLLQTEDPRVRLEALMAERDPLYREVADLVMDTDERSVRSVVHESLDRLKELSDPTTP
ncbi:MAG TPA: shikimate kinase AroK [Gammaproteobacteria bacterium]|nr:shikimate kinase AroK [Gammaproteobacteria bacterium]